MTRRVAAILLAAAIGYSGCGGAGSSTTSPVSSGATVGSDPVLQMEHAVRVALEANLRVSGYVLWHDALPSWATQSTRASALAALRTSARDRRNQGIRIRVLSNRVEVVGMHIDPSYTSATAVVHDLGRVVPYRHGRPLGRAIKLDEHARVELRRIGDAPRFVVWKVTSVR